MKLIFHLDIVFTKGFMKGATEELIVKVTYYKKRDGLEIFPPHRRYILYMISQPSDEWTNPLMEGT